MNINYGFETVLKVCKIDRLLNKLRFLCYYVINYYIGNKLLKQLFRQ